MDIKQVVAGVLDIGYVERGPANGLPVILLHGFPYDVHCFDEVCDQLAAQGYRCFVPYLRGYGPTRFLSPETMRSGQQAALAADLLAFMDALGIEKAVLGGYDWGGRAACIVAALWPERVVGLVSAGHGYNLQDIPNAGRPGSPEEETRFWYQYYFHTARGRDGLTQNRFELCRHIWALWSPSWAFDEATYARSAAAFDNPDFVDVVLHSYQHRYGVVAGDPAYQAIEDRLEAQPVISVPTIVVLGADDGVDPPSQADKESHHFAAAYQRRVLAGVGHNAPQEAPKAFADAVLELASRPA